MKAIKNKPKKSKNVATNKSKPLPKKQISSSTFQKLKHYILDSLLNIKIYHHFWRNLKNLNTLHSEYPKFCTTPCHKQTQKWTQKQTLCFIKKRYDLKKIIKLERNERTQRGWKKFEMSRTEEKKTRIKRTEVNKNKPRKSKKSQMFRVFLLFENALGG